MEGFFDVEQMTKNYTLLFWILLDPFGKTLYPLFRGETDCLVVFAGNVTLKTLSVASFFPCLSFRYSSILQLFQDHKPLFLVRIPEQSSSVFQGSCKISGGCKSPLLIFAEAETPGSPR